MSLPVPVAVDQLAACYAEATPHGLGSGIISHVLRQKWDWYRAKDVPGVHYAFYVSADTERRTEDCTEVTCPVCVHWLAQRVEIVLLRERVHGD